MPFGHKIAPGTFQLAVDVILSTEKWQYALIYLDDIIEFSGNVGEHMVHVRKVLALLAMESLILKLNK